MGAAKEEAISEAAVDEATAAVVALATAEGVSELVTGASDVAVAAAARAPDALDGIYQ